MTIKIKVKKEKVKKPKVVWVMSFEDLCDGGTVLGVFSTKEKALKAAEGHFLTNHYDTRASDVNWTGEILNLVDDTGYYGVWEEAVR